MCFERLDSFADGRFISLAPCATVGDPKSNPGTRDPSLLGTRHLLAVEHGMGGPNSQMIALQFVDYLTELFFNNGDIEPDEIVDILTDVMDSQFHTLCEDNSPDEVGNMLWKLFQACKAGDEIVLQEEVNKLPVSRHKINFAHQRDIVTDDVTSKQGSIFFQNTCKENIEEEDPEWTQVTHRKRKQ